MGSARDGAQDVEIGEEGLRGRGVRAHGGARRVVGHAQHEQRIGEDQVARGGGARDVGLIEPADLPGGQPMRRNRLGEASAVGRVGARQRHEVLHGGVRHEVAGVHVLLDRIGQRAHQTQAPGHPAHAVIEAPRQRVERQAVVLMQRAQQPALLERARGPVGVQQLPKDQRLRLRHFPDHRRHGVALEPLKTPDPLVAVHDHVRGAGHHDHDRHLLTRLRQRRQQPVLPRRLPHPQPLIPHVDLMKFQLHGRSVRWGLLSHRADQVLPYGPGKSAAKPCALNELMGALVLRGSGGEVRRFLLWPQALGSPSGLVRP